MRVPPRARRAVIVLVAVDLVLLCLAAAAALWLWRHDGEMRGSIPPAGQRVPALGALAGITPRAPSSSALTGDPVAIVATCIECPEGEVLGGFLQRLGRDLPDDARLLVLGWDGDIASWARASGIPVDWQVHAVEPRARAAVHRALHASDTSLLLLYDRDGHWRTTYHLGMLDVDDVRHDLEVLARE